MREPSQVGDARRQAARLAAGLHFNELALGRLALVVTELATNLVRHAQQGLLLVGVYGQGAVPAIEVIAIDGGPGIRHIDASLADGVSTGGTAGTGLGAVRRLSSQFIAYSKPGFGTTVVARLTADNSPLLAGEAAAPLAYAGLCVAAPLESVSGDSWACRRRGTRLSILLADGLGHGPEAAAAADAAVEVLHRSDGQGPRALVERCHLALRSTRGAALAVIDVDTEAKCIEFCGAGNITARILSGVEDRSLMSQHGTVGLQLRQLQELRYEVPAHALLVAHSDGIVSRWDLKDAPELLSCDPVVLAAHLVRSKLRGRDDATVVVVQLHQGTA